MAITRKELKVIKSYLTKKGRKNHNRYIAEGVRLLEDSYRHQVYPELLIYSRAHLDVRAEHLLMNFRKKEINVAQVSANDFKLLSDTKTPQGVLGVFKMQEQTGDESLSKKCRKILWCENISDPGNVGTLFRSALAFGYQTVFVSGDTADIYSPKVVRATMGAIFKIKVVKDSTNNLLQLVRKNKLTLIASDMHGKPIHFVKKQIEKSRFVLAVGSEGFGLSPEIKSKSDMSVRIDHNSAVESLNAAVAGSILMNDLQKEG